MKGDHDAGDFAGAVFPAVGVYREVVPNERLAFTLKGLEEGPPAMILTTVIFEDQGRKTKLTIRWAPSNATDEERKTFDSSHDGMRQGWGGTMDQLADYLAEARQG